MNTNTTNNAVTITGNGTIVAVISGKHYTAMPDHPQYPKLLDNARHYKWDEFVKNYDLVQNVSMYVNEGVQIIDGAIYYKGHILHNTLTKRILNFMRNDLPFDHLLKFLNNLLQNPSMRAVNELYDFLDVGKCPITTDGHFLAYKNVKADYKDIHSGTFDNSVGSICEMPRNLVDEDKDRTCSYGLHFCSIDYLPHFSDSNGGHTMRVKINPRDVVAIPADYNNTKGRTCRYEVIGEYTEDWRSKLNRGESGWDAELYNEDGSEYDNDEDDTEYCANCNTILDNWDENSEMLCNSCYDDKYSGCYGGGCAGKTTNEDTTTDCDENHCFCDKQDENGDIKCDKDYPKTSRNYDPVKEPEVEEFMQNLLKNLIQSSEVGNEGKDGCCGGQCGCENNHNNQYGVKPNGQLFHNLRDALGKFIKKNQ